MAEPKIVDISEAAKHFLELLRKVERGGEVIIARGGHPVAHLSPIKAARKERAPGDAEASSPSPMTSMILYHRKSSGISRAETMIRSGNLAAYFELNSRMRASTTF
jgi:prevent-host-death family protein